DNSHPRPRHWRPRSVCESQNYWSHKTTAVDQKGNTVSVLQEIQTQRGPIQQYFYETRCVQRTPGWSGEETGVQGASCLGVDRKQWNSKCIAKQSFVRALTKYGSSVGWRWIRIDSSCVCVLMSRTNSRGGRRWCPGGGGAEGGRGREVCSKWRTVKG
uniref:Neurotrophin-4 n=1 Tax=Neogobius melanostomus TaxID=47308 RepID=A0A8C6TPR7_9GOBI